MRNAAIEKSLNRKMRPRYLGPLVVLSRNRGGAYILCELDGSVLHRPVAAFRIIPYFPRKSLKIPNSILVIDTTRLRELKVTDEIDKDHDETFDVFDEHDVEDAEDDSESD